MPETIEDRILRSYVLDWLHWAKTNLPPNAREIKAIWTDPRRWELQAMASREQRLLQYGATLRVSMLKDCSHRAWAIRLGRLADAVPDTHGLLIQTVWESLPQIFRKIVARNHTDWDAFVQAIYCSTDGQGPARPLPKPWHALPPPRHPNKRNTSHEAPSRSGLAIKLTRYAPKTWRGHNPDSRQLLERPRSPDAAWDDDPYSELLGKLKYSGEMIDKIEGMAGQIHEVLVGRLSTLPQLRLSTLPELKRQLRMMEALLKFLDLDVLFPSLRKYTCMRRMALAQMHLRSANTIPKLMSVFALLSPAMHESYEICQDLYEERSCPVMQKIDKPLPPYRVDQSDDEESESGGNGRAREKVKNGVKGAKSGGAKGKAKGKGKNRSNLLKGQTTLSFTPLSTSATSSNSVSSSNSNSASAFASSSKSTSSSCPSQTLLDFGFSTAGTERATTTKMSRLSAKRLGKNKNRDEDDDDDIDGSVYLWPESTFPVLQDASLNAVEAMKATGMNFLDVEFDPRDMVLFLGSCGLEIELLLHCSPNIWTNEQARGMARVPASHRGFKIVIALEMATHTLAFCSHDNNSRVRLFLSLHWLSLDELDTLRSKRVPDVVYEFWAWSKYTVEWLKRQGTRHDNKRVGAVLVVMRQAVEANHIGKDSFMLISSVKDMLRYRRELKVHRKLRTATSARRGRLIEMYNEASRKTHQQSTFFNTSAETELHNVPWAFDVAEVADTVLTFGGLGPILLGDSWEAESTKATIPKSMMEIYLKKLPSDLTYVQKLCFKPLPYLDPDELETLIQTFGDTVNPLVRYFQRAGLSLLEMDAESDEDEADSIVSEEIVYLDPDTDWRKALNSNLDSDDPDDSDWAEDRLSSPSTTRESELAIVKWTPTLIPDVKQTHLPTKLYTDMQVQPKSVWTLFHAPASTLFPNPDHSPPNALVFRARSDDVRRVSTMEYIHKHTAKYSVGPAAFCGHARLIENGNESLSLRQQSLALSAVTSRRNPNKGFQRGILKIVDSEKTWRLKVKKEMQKEMGCEPTDAQLDRELRRLRKDKKRKADTPPSEASPSPRKSARLGAKFEGEQGEELMKTQASRALGLVRRKPRTTTTNAK
ncbi:hypothetical protein C8J57DRAFT_1253827 [Mycena rebaudengoi]|nr:hypothetical protein C8J57DRAFT_1253827 [Mycena rebaudengoi]